MTTLSLSPSALGGKVMKTVDYIDAIKARYGWSSDYRLGKETGWSKARISKWRRHGVEFDEEAAILAAELLGIDAGEVLANIAAARTECPVARQVWQQVAQRLHAA